MRTPNKASCRALVSQSQLGLSVAAPRAVRPACPALSCPVLPCPDDFHDCLSNLTLSLALFPSTTPNHAASTPSRSLLFLFRPLSCSGCLYRHPEVRTFPPGAPFGSNTITIPFLQMGAGRRRHQRCTFRLWWQNGPVQRLRVQFRSMEQ